MQCGLKFVGVGEANLVECDGLLGRQLFVIGGQGADKLQRPSQVIPDCVQGWQIAADLGEAGIDLLKGGQQFKTCQCIQGEQW